MFSARGAKRDFQYKLKPSTRALWQFLKAEIWIQTKGIIRSALTQNVIISFSSDILDISVEPKNRETVKSLGSKLTPTTAGDRIKAMDNEISLPKCLYCDLGR